jgi:hypothetical protein
LVWNETYHLFDELKVVIMSDGYGIRRALLWRTLSRAESRNDKDTDLRDII